jgi:hypothetical protein
LHHPLICFALAFGARPSRSSLGCELGLPRGRPLLRRLLAKPSTPSTPHSPAGPYDAFRCLPTRPPRATLRWLADRPGLPHPALLVACICQPCLRLDRPWAPLPSEVSPRSRRPGHTPLAEASRPQPGPSSLPFPVSPRRPAVRQTPATRRRDSEDSCSTARPHVTARPGYPNGCVLRRRRCSRPRRVAPLLVVTPLRG